MRGLLGRLALGDRPKDDPEFDAALDSALSRARENSQRLEQLQRRVQVIERK